MSSITDPNGLGWVLGGDGKYQWTGSGIAAWEKNGTSVYYDGGNVGVGTAAPAYALDVVGTIKGDSTLLLNSATTSSFMQASTNAFQMGTSSTAPLIVYTDNTERMRIDANGLVGIGTDTPQGVLHLNSGFSSALVAQRSNNKIALEMTSLTSGGYGFYDINAAQYDLYMKNGSVGIGTTSPSSELNVYHTFDPEIRLTIATHGDAGVLLGDADGLKIYGKGNGNQMRFHTGSTEQMRIDSAGNLNLGDATWYAAAANRRHLHIKGGTNGAFLALTAGASGDAYIEADANGGFNVWNRANGNTLFGTNNLERVRIDSAGRLMIGKSAVSNSTAGYFLEPGSGGYASFVNTADSLNNRVLLLNREGGDGAILECRRANTTVGKLSSEGFDLAIGNGDAGVQFVDGTRTLRPFNVTTNARVDDSIDLGMSTTRWRNLYLSGGAYLGGTGSGNFLDDYEEGNWTPVASSGCTSLTVDVSNCRYTKIGNTVHVRGEISGIVGQNAATFVIGGLPFSIATGVESSFAVMYTQINIDTNYSQLVGYAEAGSNKIRLYECGDSQTWSAVIGTQTNSSTSLIFALTYETS